jgi:Flp pilus assembly CpaE family ATPase
MAIYLLDSGAGSQQVDLIERRVLPLLPELTRVETIAQVQAEHARAPEDTAYILVAAPSRDRQRFTELLRLAAGRRDGLFFIIVNEELSASDYKALTRTGCAEWVSLNADPQEIIDIIVRHRLARAGSKEADPRATAVALVPSAGGVGNTTLAVEIGVFLKTRKASKDRNICIIDLDFQSSHVCDFLDIEPRLKIQEISSNPERLDEHLFEIFISRHASGLHVFAAPRGRFDVCQLDVAALDAFISMAALRYDVMLIDLPLTKYDWTAQLIAASDRAIVTGLNTVPGLRQIAECLADIRAGVQVPEVAIAINRCERRLIGGVARKRHVESLLTDEKVFYVGAEPSALQSINTGVPMMLAKSSAALQREISAIAAFCGQTKPTATKVAVHS